VTRLTALRTLLATPRDHVDQGRIGRVQKYDTPDGRERMTYVFKILRSISQLRRSA
jgi:hypothetical protein